MKSKIQLLSSMVIFGTMGVFVRYIDASSSVIALFRGFIGSAFLIFIFLFLKQKISIEKLKANAVILLLSGVVLAGNWMFLLQAYKNTTLSNAALSYYFAPVFVLIFSPFILKEKFSIKKMTCIAAAMLGMLLVMQNNSGITEGYHHAAGITYGFIAALFYASLILLNKFIKGLTGFETTVIQLTEASFLLLLYVLFVQGAGALHLAGGDVLFVIILGIVHTGIGFYLFFSALKDLKGQNIASLSYVEPVTSVFMSVFILHESMTIVQFAGAGLLLGAIFISEKTFRKSACKDEA
jgi:drug/metabolite transporter (DMT)-like permease